MNQEPIEYIREEWPKCPYCNNFNYRQVDEILSEMPSHLTLQWDCESCGNTFKVCTNKEITYYTYP